MTQALRKYYEIRKLPKIVSLLKYLKQLYKDKSDPLFANASRSNLIKMAKSLMKRLFEVHHEDFEEEVEEEGLESDDFEENVNMALKKVSKSATREDKDFKSIPKDMASFDVHGKLSYNLEILFKALLSLPTFSVESERNFSAAGLFLTKKKRTKLSDKTFDNLCFLRSYFLAKKSQQNEK